MTQDVQAENERVVAEKIGDLSCAFAAADELASTCAVRHEDAGFDLDVVEAAEQLWRRAAGESHALTVALAELDAELRRHRDVLLQLQDRFDALMHGAPHDHVSPAAEDVRRIRAAVLGPEPAAPPS